MRPSVFLLLFRFFVHFILFYFHKITEVLYRLPFNKTNKELILCMKQVWIELATVYIKEPMLIITSKDSRWCSALMKKKKRWLIENRTTGRRVQRLGICSFLFVWKNNSCVFRVYSVWQKKKKTQHNESKRTQICSAWYTALIMNRVRNSSWSRIAFAFTFPFSFDVHFTSAKLYFPSSMRCFCRNFGMVFFCMV